MKNKDYRILNNIGKIGCILDILNSIYHTYEEDSEVRTEIQECMDDIEALSSFMVADYNEEQNKQ